ncbi:MAG TPA: ATP-binding protein [Thermoguttaceae bacterium]|nr:ATP-binding protein [Thermoguttaceae bacterium]
MAEPPIATDPYQTSQIWPRGGRSSLTGALLDRLTHRIHILEANGEGHRLRESRPG